MTGTGHSQPFNHFGYQATMDWLDSVAKGGYQESEFNGGFPAMNLKSGRSPADPFLSVAFLQTGHSAKSRFYELEVYKAAIGDLTNRPISNLRG